MLREKLIYIYNILYENYGPRRWWPADTPLEVAVGAILTQNTNWVNVEKAIKNLKVKKVLRASTLNKLDQKTLAKLIRPSGYYNIKAKRLKSFISYLFNNYSGSMANLGKRPLRKLRDELLGIKGIGPETADSIILYAAGKPIFVVDSYTRRMMSCLGVIDAGSSYEKMQSVFMSNLPRSTKLFNEYHALIVEHSKRVCRAKPLCADCFLSPRKSKRQDKTQRSS
ncbi:MAG: endonuclease III domain-containing protein [Candidatus Omnitrophota bacterium]